MQDDIIWSDEKENTRIVRWEDGKYHLQYVSQGRWAHVDVISEPGVQRITGVTL